ncbi:uncharacterized protein B0I36DRAFT_362372 [Microdochium trichocladiopsis]|uniref:Cyanovirin-N domain-containing protein n=1 Tax=Microdochium trichocladiopsis TaxID=1682393 RepID=A0A9P8Y9P0_9PEZI|nr:uncharacterized protein B0I36DRAFT_362372 [Microdochium trichocladiopsis]KAH7033739.1 hypothetical protein B0I36DRAFT_362372 [Microdochium trichocladiopsis]
MQFKTATIVAFAASLGGNVFASAAPVADVAVPETPTSTSLEIREILADKTVSLGKRDGGFLGSCKASTVGFDIWDKGKTWLIAECRTLDGAWRSSKLNMNRCFVNDNGYLQFRQNGGYGGSCDVAGSYITADMWLGIRCKNVQGELMPSREYSLNAFITNASGQLMCFGGST